MALGASLDRLLRVLGDAGLRNPAPPKDDGALPALARAVAPWTLPADLVEFWSRVDPFTVPVLAPIGFYGPDVALEAWPEAVEGHQPMHFVDVAYESHDCIAVELDTGHGTGGELWYWNLVDGDFRFVAPGLAGMFAAIADVVEAGEFAVLPGGWREDLFDVAAIEFGAYRAALCRRLGVEESALPTIDRDPAGWPERWPLRRPGVSGGT